MAFDTDSVYVPEVSSGHLLCQGHSILYKSLPYLENPAKREKKMSVKVEKEKSRVSIVVLDLLCNIYQPHGLHLVLILVSFSRLLLINALRIVNWAVTLKTSSLLSLKILYLMPWISK